MPLVSVIVPVYNAEKYLSRCLDSILAQTFTDFELLLVDDGSKDRSGVICDEYAAIDNRVRVFHQDNQGQSVARNTALDWVFANSDSEWLCFIDSDDWVDIRYIESMLHVAQKHKTDVSVCLHTRITSDGVPVDQFDFTSEDRLFSYDEYFSITGPGYTPYTIWGKLIKRDLFSQFRFPAGHVMEDLYLTHRVLAQSKRVARVNKVLYYYFLSDNSTMRACWTPKKMDEVIASEQLMEFMQRNGYVQASETAIKRHLWVLEKNLKELRETGKKSYCKYEKAIIKKLRRFLVAYGKKAAPLKDNVPLYDSAFPAISWLYWTCRGVFGKLKRMVKK